MLKRLAVVADSGAVDKAAVKAAQAEGLELLFVAASGQLPAGTSAVLGPVENLTGALTWAANAAQQHEDLLFLLADSLDAREGLLPGSSRRVMDHATRFAKAMKLSADEQLVLERAALLREIGKISIPNDVLLKEGLLSYDEWLLIQQHPHLGSAILEKTPALADIAEVVKNHHESFDGDGYPDALEGEAVPLLARALKILDVYCAMTSPRHYRKGFSNQQDAIEYLRSEQGKHFDPDLIEAFVKSRVGKPWDLDEES